MNVEPRAIPFVEVSSDGKFQINEEAVEFIESLPQPLSIIACAGAYRTGKSLFLNRGLLQVEPGKGFAVGNTTNACTKGLWIHTSLIQVARKAENETQSYTNVLIIDTEGLGAFDANDSHDTKIFALALLLCSYFIYNSAGKIDEDAIGKLSLVCNVCKQVKANAAANKNDDGDADEQNSNKKRKREESNMLSEAAELSNFFPQFLWLLRDFSLLLEDSTGASISSKQYLENALADKVIRSNGENEEIRKSIDEKNQLRKMLRQLFSNRDCATLMRPCVDEAQLQKLDTLGDTVLRPEFLKQLAQLRKKVFRDAPHKLALENRPISGRGLVQLARSYVDAFNRGAAPVIRDSWNLLLEVQCRDAIDDAKTVFVASLAQQLQQTEGRGMNRAQFDQAIQTIVDGGDAPFTLLLLPQNLEEILNAACKAAVDKYNVLCFGASGDGFLARLTTDLESMCARVRVCNARNIEKTVEHAVDQAEESSLPQLILPSEKQFASASVDIAQFSILLFKPIFSQYQELIEEAVTQQLASATIDPRSDSILSTMLQRQYMKRTTKWALQIEEHWMEMSHQLCKFIATVQNQVEAEISQTKEKLETLTESFEKLKKENAQDRFAFEVERKTYADQRKQLDDKIVQLSMEEEVMRTKHASDQAKLEKDYDEYRISCDTEIEKFQQLLSQSRAETTSATMQRDSAVTNLTTMEQRCEQMSTGMDQLHEEVETLRGRIKTADQTVSRLRNCEADLQQMRAESARVATEYSTQLAALEKESVASLSKIRATNEKTRKEQEERLADLQQQYEQIQTTSQTAKKLLEGQVASLTDKLVQVRHDANVAAEKAALDLQQSKDKLQICEQSLIDVQDQHKRQLQEKVAKFELETKAFVQTARDESKRVAQEKAELQRQLNEAVTDAACQRVRNEHLQSKLQDETTRGELQQVKKDFERAAQLNEKLRNENEQLLAQQRAHQHELQERERRIEQVQKKMQEQEREFSAERLRLRLRIEEENAQQAQQAYRKSLTEDSTNTAAPRKIIKK